MLNILDTLEIIFQKDDLFPEQLYLRNTFVIGIFSSLFIMLK